MFIDSAEIIVSSGKGGAGAVSFRREKFIIQGGPDGGDGGDGGDVYFEVDTNADTLTKFRGKHHYKAKNGFPGEGKKKSGKKGESITLKIPLGTQIIDIESGELLLDFTTKERILFLKGGKGGAGNFRFRNSVNQKPTYAQKGLDGAIRKLRLELKVIADVGLVGFPNAGKSTLLSVISNAKPEIADYAFTTLIPNLGVVNVDEFNSFVIADIPGIINGASIGKGLGLEFLKHIERTKIFLFMLDSTQDSLLSQFSALANEVANFDKSLTKRAFGIALTKIDAIDKNTLDSNLAKLNAYFGIHQNVLDSKQDVADSNVNNTLHNFTKPLFIMPISSLSKVNLDTLKTSLYVHICATKDAH